MSSVLINIVVGLITSVISGTAVWTGQRLLALRRRQRAAVFFGVRAGERCRLVIYRTPWQPSPDSMRHADVQALVDLAVLLRELGAEPEVVPFDQLAEGPGHQTEFCIGGPTVNARTQTHLARYLPGVTMRPWDRTRRDSIAIVVGEQQFLHNPPLGPGRTEQEQVYAVLARFVPPSGDHPVFVISGQTALANRGAVQFLTRPGNQRQLRRLADGDATGGGRFCLVVQVASPRVYGHQLVEVASDATAAAFAPTAASQPE
ncbi:MAG TPA: hypothetical protein VFA45_26075 [Actinomycetes bacterium]|nr:hypothetical protein [Actinomycetes bacterium]